MRIFKNVLSMCLIVACLVSLCGCRDNETYDNYSYGLDENGLYENLEKYAINVPDYKGLNLTCDGILDWAVKEMQDAEREEIKTVDDYVYAYGNELLAGLNLASKDVVDEGDLVSATLEFFVDGKKLTNFASNITSSALSDGDSIVCSFAGHKVGDKYDVQYVFPDDDKDYPGKEATVKIEIGSIVSGDPIKDGMVELNLEKLGEYIDGVTDSASFLVALRPKIVEALLPGYIQSWVISSEWDVPDEFVDYEMYRLKYRLNRLGYTYEEYLEAVKMTDEENREYCKTLVKENVFVMRACAELNINVVDKDLDLYYGENREYMERTQGAPYLRLSVMRTLVWDAVPQHVKVEGLDVVSPSN